MTSRFTLLVYPCLKVSHLSLLFLPFHNVREGSIKHLLHRSKQWWAETGSQTGRNPLHRELSVPHLPRSFLLSLQRASVTFNNWIFVSYTHTVIDWGEEGTSCRVRQSQSANGAKRCEVRRRACNGEQCCTLLLGNVLLCMATVMKFNVRHRLCFKLAWAESRQCSCHHYTVICHFFSYHCRDAMMG